ncbi:MAG TPA: 3-dehydroquinate synthase [Acidimicrobiia bacterium]|jgi:3-dehydroquinate synthase|nr:3-dehydroquinate synthase [Acidimicrobiia bacterium]
MKRVTVRVDPPYDVVVGPGALSELGALLAGRRRVAVVSQATVAEHHADAVQAAAANSELFLVGDGEPAKTLTTVERLARDLSAWGLLRDDVVVALGGGVVGDVAGFTAAVYHRGVSVVQVPTTLLAQIDAAVGGKTGVNLPEGKNLLGAFHQPIAVVADVDTLRSLPEREYRAGLGEVAKYALIAQLSREHDGLAEIVEADAKALRARNPDALTELVYGCVELKADVVARDPEERSGVRAVLNYGHTFAHALEASGEYDDLLHGEAVAVGLVFAGQLAAALGRVDASTAERHRQIVSALGLTGSAPEGLDASKLLELMRRDKKAKGGLTFVLPGPNGFERVDDPPASALERALESVGVEG